VKSIRLYLIVVLLSTICLVNFLAALHGYRNSMAEANQMLDEQLTDMVRLLSLFADDSREVPPNLYPHSVLFQIWNRDTLLKHSPNAPSTVSLPREPGFHMSNHLGVSWRILVYLDEGGQYMIIVGQRADAYAKLIEEIVLESILPIIWVLPILGVLIWLIVSFGLQPLKRLAGLLKERRAGDLEPVAKEGYPLELDIVVASINHLLARLSGAFDREKNFAADAAHELRTPLAALNVGLHNLAAEIDHKNPSLLELQSSVERMGHSIEQIIALYRLTPEKFHNAMTLLDLNTLAKKVIVELYDICRKKNQEIELETEKISIEGDDFAFITLLRNLIDNASKYTPLGGKIFVKINKDGGNAILTVEDSGPGISEAYHGRVFDRFYRVGGDRHDSKVIGCGLGLSIVERIVRLHQGRIELSRSDTLGGLAVRVILPLRQDRAVGVDL